MKWYLSLVAVILMGVFFYQLHLMKKFEPSLDSLSQSFSVTGTMHYKDLGRMGNEPLLNGQSLFCSANILGGKDQCISLIPSLKEGVAVTASVVEMRTRSGVIWLAMEITTATGEHYRAKPEDVIQEWRRYSYQALWRTPLFLSIVLIVIPWFIRLKLKN